MSIIESFIFKVCNYTGNTRFTWQIELGALRLDHFFILLAADLEKMIEKKPY